MEELVDDGLAKNIGVSNFSGSLLYDLHNYARYEPQVLQIEHHPYLTQEPLVNYAKLKGMAVTAYSSFGPQSFYELKWDKDADSLLTSNETIDEIAKAHKRSASFPLWNHCTC